jgi:autotransporter-associated beta strand protein
MLAGRKPRAKEIVTMNFNICQNRPRISRRSIRHLVLAAAVASTVPVARAQTSGTWITDSGTAGASWSNPANWSGNVVPDGGGNASFVTLPTFTTGPVTILQDLSNVTLSNITFDSFITYLIQPPAVGGPQTITLAGPATINTVQPSINTLNTTVFGHQMRIGIAGNSGLTKTGPGTLTLWNGSTFSGDVNINGGIVVARQFGDSVFGAASNAINMNDGTIRVTTGAWTSSRAIHLVGGGTFEPTTGNTTTFNGVVSGNGSLNKMGGASMVLTAANTYTGATNLLAGSITLSGSGAIGSTSSLALRQLLVLDNSTTNLSDRVNNAAPLTLLGGGVTMTGSASANSSETFGATAFSRGTTTVTVAPGAGFNASIATGAVTRDNGGTAFFRGTNLGIAVPSNAAQVTFANPPALVGGGGASGSTNISIIPWAFGNTNAAAAANAGTNSFVTYSAGLGVRPLDTTTEYATSFAAAGATDNVRLTAADVVAAPRTINSLIVASGGGAITGAGPLSVSSGAVMNLVTSTVDPALNFGSAEGILFAQANLTLNGAISGNNGLTKQGSGIATFASNASNYTGTTTIGAGTAVFTASVPSGSSSPFGSSTSAVALAPAGVGTGGTTARLAYAGGSPGTFDRNLNVSSRVALNNNAVLAGFGVNGASALTMNGNIALDDSPLSLLGGAGSSLTLNGNITGSGVLVDQGSTATSTIQVNGNNTFAGGVEMQAATWQVGSNTAFGTGPLKMVQLSGQPTIQAVGGPRTIPNEAVSFSFSTSYWQIAGNQPLTFTGSINLSGSYTHNINNSALTTYAGVLHTGGFTKAGSGVLLLSGDNIYTGNTTISSGVLRISHAHALGSVEARTVVNSGAALEIGGDTLSLEPVTINGTGVSNAGAIRSTGGTNSLGPIALASSATIAVDAGKLNVGAVAPAAPGGTQSLAKVGAGVLQITNLRTAGGADIQAGSLRVRPGAAAATPAGLSTIGSVTIAGGPAAPTAKLDISNNAMIVSSLPDFGPEASSEQNARAYTTDGYNGGAWGGNGITTSPDARGDQVLAVGYASAGSIGVTNFLGTDVLATDILFRATRYGDADLSGTVDLLDFNRLAANFGQTGANVFWSSGDFNFDQAVNLLDFNKLAENFGQSAGPDGVVDPQDWSNLAAAVPEPATGCILGLSAIALTARRFRRRGHAASV